jgi:hypothetical protein
MPAILRKLERLRQLSSALRPAEPALYVLVCALVTLHVAGRFYASVRLQTLYSDYWANPELWRHGQGTLGAWSAPLDDVFIHFDFARSTAEGRPFEWVHGNGFSSGSTSLLYPFVLAAGYALGFRELELMHWAAIVACVSVFALLLSLRRAFDGLPAWAPYLSPFALLGIGALSWSLFSGMEIAFFLALWGGAFVAWKELMDAPANSPAGVLLGRSAALGLWGGLLVATRPEGAVTVALLGTSAAWSLRARGAKLMLLALSLVAIPGAAVVVGSAIANLVLTGETAAAGAIAKLELYHPYLSRGEKVYLWLYYLGYQALRLTQQHLASIPAIGWFVWVMAFAALWAKETRRVATFLWACLLGWAMTVALNGQVRWQNERYSMPALTWLLVAATLGASALVTRGFQRPRHQGRIVPLVATVLGSILFVWQAEPNFRFQAWYFGRGARNIYDQHVTLGRVLRLDRSSPTVLVGDAGAIPYMSEGPTLDLIGLGGYKRMPFARATRSHVGSAVELIEHLPPAERPSLLAIYPSWWDELPLWFGKRLFEVPARGNVICGAPSAVVYQASWDALTGSERPFRLRAGARVTAEFDWADVVSEAAAEYDRLPANGGRVAIKILAHPTQPRRDVFDAGRNCPEGTRESFTLHGLEPGLPFSLVFRAAPVADREVPVSIDGRLAGRLRLPRTDGWVEVELPLPPADRPSVRVELGESGERVLYHVWAVQGP